MDLLATLSNKLDALQEGDYTPGLRATLLHIETAFGHLSRGQRQQEETAFTDAIYRTNQAFEGSIKEAYRVLASKDPSRKRPYDIEKYLEQKGVFRPRVLSLFTNYRTEWRNPSTHDYKLDFDESEAFLAIVSVSAFACLLFDQIIEYVSYQKAKAAADAHKAELSQRLPAAEVNLLERATQLLSEFHHQQQKLELDTPRKTEIQVLGVLAGFLASAAPDIEVSTEVSLVPARRERGDMLFSRGDERVLIELKTTKVFQPPLFQHISQVEHYLAISGMKNAVLYLYSDEAVELEKTEHSVSALGARIVILRPAKTRSN